MFVGSRWADAISFAAEAKKVRFDVSVWPHTEPSQFQRSAHWSHGARQRIIHGQPQLALPAPGPPAAARWCADTCAKPSQKWPEGQNWAPSVNGSVVRLSGRSIVDLLFDSSVRPSGYKLRLHYMYKLRLHYVYTSQDDKITTSLYIHKPG